MFVGHAWVLGFWLLFMVALVAGAIVLIVLAVRWTSHAQHRMPPPPYGFGPQQALAELDLRYARGEVTRDEYLQRRADLLGHPGMPPFGPGTTGPGPTAPGTPPV
ncbi:MAG: SHOCT domain-containing protein [Candidatus Dormibacteraeota bacterium]|nr:SHOCT domain-containing protein [Candidatus Dormibacteraeota bacterium]